MSNYYDLVLGLIPLALGGVAAVLFVMGVSLTTAVGLSGGLSMAMIGHAMFVRAPVDTPTESPATEAPAAGDAGFGTAD
jgi:hypothetical protein